jgi:hypothetical protein
MTSLSHTATIVQSGYFKGNRIRTARKAGKCADFRHCGNMIEVGDLYVEGEGDPYKAGGFGRERLCLACGENAQ